MSGGRWAPLLLGEERTRALRAVEAIAIDLARAGEESDSARPALPSPIGGPASLGAGLAGSSLFFAYSHSSFPDQGL